jgi:hypothetical protein
MKMITRQVDYRRSHLLNPYQYTLFAFLGDLGWLSQETAPSPST